MSETKEKYELSKETRKAAELIRSSAGLPPEWTPERINNLVKSVVPEGASMNDIAAFLAVCHHYDLNPLLRQIYLIKVKGRYVVCVERDGFVAVCNRFPDFRGFQTGVVRENDEYSMERTGIGVELHHKTKGLTHEERGPIRGAYAIGWRQAADGVLIATPVERGVEYYQHLKDDKRREPWQVYEEDMWLARVIAVCARQMYPITGVYVPEELPVDDEHYQRALTETATARNVDEVKAGLSERLNQQRQTVSTGEGGQ